MTDATETLLLDAGMSLTLRPMRYPVFYDMYLAAIKNTWTVDEVDLSTDIGDLRQRMTPAERHLINRLVTFFATGDTIVANNLVLNLYKHVNAPEARMFLSRQLYEEAVHIQFYLTLLDTYIPDAQEREAAFAAVENIPSIKQKADFCFKWQDSMYEIGELRSRDDRRRFLLNLICFVACTKGGEEEQAFGACGKTDEVEQELAAVVAGAQLANFVHRVLPFEAEVRLLFDGGYVLHRCKGRLPL